MKHIFLLITVLIISSCSKDDTGPMGFTHGQEVEVFIDHGYGAIGDRPVLLPNRETSEYSLHGFDERKPGYTYTIRATVHIDSNDPPIQDAAPYWLNFTKIINKEKYDGHAPFEIALIQSYVPGGPIIMLRKYEDEYHFIPEKITLTYASEEIHEQLEEIWQHNEELRESYENKITPMSRWRAIKATVTHDPGNFGKSYLVSHIEFTEQ